MTGIQTNNQSFPQMGNKIHQYLSEFLIYANGRCGSTSISNNPAFDPVVHIQNFIPVSGLPDTIYLITREPEARLISALYQMYRKLYQGPGDWPGDWNIRIQNCEGYFDHEPRGRVHDWGLPQYIPGTDRCHIQNYISDLKQMSDTWGLNVKWLDLSEKDQLLSQYSIPNVGRHGVLENNRTDYDHFRTAIKQSAGWNAWQSYITPEQKLWDSVVTIRTP